MVKGLGFTVLGFGPLGSHGTTHRSLNSQPCRPIPSARSVKHRVVQIFHPLAGYGSFEELAFRSRHSFSHLVQPAKQ